ncbi:MAG: [FeFe] hydrogenase H-cluster radical SAM maturase HydE [Deltaproteobacteria bacterium]|jgi:biotin synthase|nr:[FeFe] hydrogenase H-cluster radical SAM maturase HydE [Deltaproteobacteria bacterium]
MKNPAEINGRPDLALAPELTDLVERLASGQALEREELIRLIDGRSPELAESVFQKARQIRQSIYGTDVFARGLIEFTNYCKNDCYYCGIRAGNAKADRYRLTTEEILQCCEIGRDLGFRTFVLQGGEDPTYPPTIIADLVRKIDRQFPDCAITLSLGERPRKDFQLWREAGADRYLLRHETYNSDHYAFLHPPNMSRDNRIRCLYVLKELGYQVGCGFMVGSPGQTTAHLAEDLLFIQDFKPQMVGIGPFIPHQNTPFAKEKPGTLDLTLFLLGLLRLIAPNVLLPATTALGTISPTGRELGVQAGANVVMPNLSPISVRSKYLLYDNKICVGEEAAECRFCLNNRLDKIGYQLVVDRGDCAGFVANGARSVPTTNPEAFLSQ